MAMSSDLKEVWCETHDDITLIWCRSGIDEVEFVQVKDIDLDQLWSIAKLCQRDDSNPGSSILEKSMGEERCSEPCRFRIVTSLGVKNELEILSLPYESIRRSGNPSEYQILADRIEKRLGAIISPKGRSIRSWIERALWQVEHSTEAISQKNNNLLAKIISKLGYEIPPEVVEEKIYPQLLQLVKTAAEIDPDIDLIGKRIGRDSIFTIIKLIVDELIQSHRYSAGRDMSRKMEDAKIPHDYILTALDERRMYRQEILVPRYMEFSDHELIEGEVISNLQSLRLELDAGNMEEGLLFYQACLSHLDSLRMSIGTKTTSPSFYFHGCMHDIADRCGHRYLRGQP